MGFYPPEGGKTRLTITDATGKLVKVLKGNYGNGYQTISVKDSDLNGAGVYFYELTSGNFKATRKMVLIF
ncbi:MAG: T9SS type A sorting domain-containing protein [Saprospiraceae bacterium]